MTKMTKTKKKNSFSIDETIQNTKFDFCGNLKWFLIAPIAILVIGLVILCTLGFNLGMDFTGGSTMTIYIAGEGSEYVVNTSASTYTLDDLDAIERVVTDVLDDYGLTLSSIQTTTMDSSELGLSGADAVLIKYQNNDDLTSDEIESVNSEIRIKLLAEFGYIDVDLSSTDIADVDLDDYDYAGLVRNDGVTTASASAELIMNSFIALLVAVVLILIYIVFRFELTSGLAAILALFHDLLVTASIVLICRIEINVSFIAALITILGYSINNTIIVFDHMRESVKGAKMNGAKIDNKKIANGAVKATMSRSILTTITTFIMIFMITVIGVSDIREFAFPIMVGILAGFYSSMFITPGLWAIAYRPHKKKKQSAAQTKKETGTTSDVVEVTAE